ncbi:hypothetical protein, partial [Donghicola mangrovi]|uniref:hypothetical protein n=1 Tax=Donghicola mangrovi TaxID=2729614 RepID=UPI001D145E71
AMTSDECEYTAMVLRRRKSALSPSMTFVLLTASNQALPRSAVSFTRYQLPHSETNPINIICHRRMSFAKNPHLSGNQITIKLF